MKLFLLVLAAACFAIMGPLKAEDLGYEIKVGVSERIEQPWQELEAVVVFKLRPGKYINSVFKEGFGQKTRFDFSGNGFLLSSPFIEPKPKKVVDEFVGTMWIHENTVFFRQPLKIVSTQNLSIAINITGQICDEALCIPFDRNFVVDKSLIIEVPKEKSSKTNVVAPVEQAAQANNQGLWSLFWTGLVGGLVAMLTPCVFPMIPITISYFLKQAQGDRKRQINLALVYSLGIIVMFTGLGLVLTKFLGGGGVNWLAVNPWVNLFIGLLFTFFAFSFLGAFDLQLPSWMVQASFKSGQTGGYLGALVMGLTFAVTSFTCTAPVVGSSLALAAFTGNYLGPTIVMLGFSGVIAVVFFGLALFPGALQSLPKSGGWLGSVKVILGFLELALALKFFRVVDIRWDWGFLSHDMVLVLWVVISFLTFLYLAGFLKWGTQAVPSGWGLSKVGAALFFGFLTVYLFRGLMGFPLNANLESFLGIDPPGYSGWKMAKMHQEEAIDWVEDYDEALAIAASNNKPLLVDYSGNACVNCIKMEKSVFPKLKEELKDFVVVRLLTDLPTEDSKRWQKMQLDKYQDASLPLYVIETSQGEKVSKISGMHSVEEFRNFLKQGLSELP